MPSSCCAVGCSNTREKGFKLYKFPWDAERREKWVKAVKREPVKKKPWNANYGTVICSAHFVEGQPSLDPLDVDYVPTIFSHKPQSCDQASSQQPKNNKEIDAIQQRRVLGIAQQKKGLRSGESTTVCAVRSTSTSPRSRRMVSNLSEVCRKKRKKSPQHTGSDTVVNADTINACGDCDALKNIVGIVTSENEYLKDHLRMLTTLMESTCNKSSSLEKQLEKTSFNIQQMSDAEVIFYTGINRKMVLLLLRVILNIMPDIGIEELLIPKKQLMLTLMKLRLAYPMTDIAFRFGVKPSVASRIFKRWIGVLCVIAKKLVLFPEMKVSHQIPKCRKKFRHLQAIIHCVEVIVSRPAKLDMRQLLWSHYKNHYSLKCLVGVNLNGSVVYLSDIYGGRTSNTDVTLECKFLDLLHTGDQLVADRGLLIRDECAARGIRIVRPSFTMDLSQQTRKSGRLSKTDIHVERAVGHLKKWRILTHTLHWRLVDYYGEIVTVVAGLANLSRSTFAKQNYNLHN